MLDIRPAGPEDRGAIKVLLAVCLLPTQDIDGPDITFFVAESERGIIGVCGVERCSDSLALLRSLGVMPGYRKQQIGRRLLQRAISHAENEGIVQLYLLTETAREYFQNSGFAIQDRNTSPAALKASRLFSQLCSSNALLMQRNLRCEATSQKAPTETNVANQAKGHFDDGYHCAESVLLAVASHAGIRSPLVPAIATGFCHGTAHTWGTCGALSGAIMAISLTHGRSRPDQSTSANYQAVQTLIGEFRKSCGSTLCSELMACDLDTRDGRKTYAENHLRSECREFVGTAAGLAAQLIESQLDHQKSDTGATAVA